MKLFVYGTLTRGASRAGLLGQAPREDARIRGRLYEMPEGFPAVVSGGEGWVHGELITLQDERILSLLDLYEGVDDGLFERVRLPVTANLRTHEAWAWVMEDAADRGGSLVRSGRWKPLKLRGAR